MFFTLPALIILIGFAVILAIRQVLTYRKIRFGRMLVTPLVTLVSCAMAAYGISRGADAAGWLILAGLGFSVAADSVLMVVEVNLMDVGLSFFLITHILYLAAFALVYSFRTPDVIIALILVVMMAYMLVRFKKGGKVGKMFIPVAVYVCALSVMVYLALGSAISTPSWATVLCACGAVLFYISDAILGWSAFVRTFRRSSFIVWSFYAPGQMLIALSVFY